MAQPPPEGCCVYNTRSMPIELRDRLHQLVGKLKRRGHRVTLEDVVTQALEIGVTMMEAGRR